MVEKSTENNGFISIYDIIANVKKILFVIKTSYKTIALVTIVFGCIGFVYAYYNKPIYKAHLSFILNENESTNLNLSSLSGLAGLAGGSISGGVNEDKLLFLSNSRFLIGTTLLTKVKIEKEDHLLINYFIDKYDVQKTFKNDEFLADFTYFRNSNLDSLTDQENKVIDIVTRFFDKNQLLKVEGKKKAGLVAQNAGIVNIDFASIDEVFAKVFVDHLYKNINKYYVNKTTQRQYRNYNLIKDRADSLEILLLSKEASGASIIDQNVNLSKMRARLTVERNKRDLELLNLMYAEVLKNLEISKFSLENQTPLLQVIDKPTYPLLKEKKSKIKFGILGGIIGAFLSLSVLFVRFLINKNDIITHKEA